MAAFFWNSRLSTSKKESLMSYRQWYFRWILGAPKNFGLFPLSFFRVVPRWFEFLGLSGKPTDSDTSREPPPGLSSPDTVRFYMRGRRLPWGGVSSWNREDQTNMEDPWGDISKRHWNMFCCCFWLKVEIRCKYPKR